MEDDTMARLRDSRNASATKHEPPQCKQRDDHLNDDWQAPDEAPLPLELRVLADSPRAAAVVGFEFQRARVKLDPGQSGDLGRGNRPARNGAAAAGHFPTTNEASTTAHKTIAIMTKVAVTRNSRPPGGIT